MIAASKPRTCAQCCRVYHELKGLELIWGAASVRLSLGAVLHLVVFAAKHVVTLLQTTCCAVALCCALRRGARCGVANLLRFLAVAHRLACSTLHVTFGSHGLTPHWVLSGWLALCMGTVACIARLRPHVYVQLGVDWASKVYMAILVVACHNPSLWVWCALVSSLSRSVAEGFPCCPGLLCSGASGQDTVHQCGVCVGLQDVVHPAVRCMRLKPCMSRHAWLLERSCGHSWH